MMTYGMQSRRPHSLLILLKALVMPHSQSLSRSSLMYFLMKLSAYFPSSLWMYQIRTNLHRHLLFCHPSLPSGRAHSHFPRPPSALFKLTAADLHHLAESMLPLASPRISALHQRPPPPRLRPTGCNSQIVGSEPFLVHEISLQSCGTMTLK